MSLEHSPARDANTGVAIGHNGGPSIDPRAFNLWQPTYSVKETIKALNDCRTHLYELISKGELHPIKRGRRTIFLASDLARYLAKLQAEPTVMSKSPRRKPRAPKPQPARPAR